jgi:hypothetical protein
MRTLTRLSLVFYLFQITEIMTRTPFYMHRSWLISPRLATGKSGVD